MEDNVPVKKKKKSGINWPATAGLTLIAVAVVLLIWFFMKGQTVVSGEFPDTETTQSVTCEANGMIHPLFKFDESTSKKMTVKVIFDKDKLSTISLVNELFYSTVEAIVQSEAENHAAMNLSYQAAGLGADALGTKFSKLSASMKMSMYATKDMVNSATERYLLLDQIDDSKEYTVALIKANYAQKGFVCVDNSK